jgi:hypothetical protein
VPIDNLTMARIVDHDIRSKFGSRCGFAAMADRSFPIPQQEGSADAGPHSCRSHLCIVQLPMSRDARAGMLRRGGCESIGALQVLRGEAERGVSACSHGRAAVVRGAVGVDGMSVAVTTEPAARSARSLMPRNIRWLMTKLMSSAGSTSRPAHRRE